MMGVSKVAGKMRMIAVDWLTLERWTWPEKQC